MFARVRVDQRSGFSLIRVAGWRGSALLCAMGSRWFALWIRIGSCYWFVQVRVVRVGSFSLFVSVLLKSAVNDFLGRDAKYFWLCMAKLRESGGL